MSITISISPLLNVMFDSFLKCLNFKIQLTQVNFILSFQYVYRINQTTQPRFHYCITSCLAAMHNPSLPKTPSCSSTAELHTQKTHTLKIDNSPGSFQCNRFSPIYWANFLWISTLQTDGWIMTNRQMQNSDIPIQ